MYMYMYMYTYTYRYTYRYMYVYIYMYMYMYIYICICIWYMYVYVHSHNFTAIVSSHQHISHLPLRHVLTWLVMIHMVHLLPDSAPTLLNSRSCACTMDLVRLVRYASHFFRSFISIERGYEKPSSVCGRDSNLAPSESEIINLQDESR